MSALAFDNGTFRAQAAIGDSVDIACAGECDLDAVEALEKLLGDIHEKGTEQARNVILDLREVSFMASSCLAKLIAWIARVRELPEADRYRIRIRSSARFPWQKRSLQAVHHFAPDIVTVEAGA